METSLNVLEKLQLAIDHEHQLLLCCRCGYALAVKHSQVTSHLRDKHQVNGFRNPADVLPRENGCDTHPQLHVYDGYSCRTCSFDTINYPDLSKHMSRTHLDRQQSSRGRIQDLYDDVYLQSWTGGPSRRYWRVRKDGNVIRPVAGRAVSEHIQSVQQREGVRAQEQRRLHSTNTTPPTLAGTRPWMERTRWETTYLGRRREILQNLTEMPWSSPWTHLLLGTRSNPAEEDIVSPKEDEVRIALITVAIDHMLDRCEETMQHTGRTILCWLRSTRAQTCYPKPFTLVALKSSKKKYRQLLKRFFAFVFRAYRMPVDVRRRLIGARFKKEQVRQMRAIWEHRAWSDFDLARGEWPGARDSGDTEDEEEDEDENDEDVEYEIDQAEDEDDKDIEGGPEGEQCDDDVDDGQWSVGSEGVRDDEEEVHSIGNVNSSVDELLELVFQLCITFSTEDFVDSQPSSSLLVYFSGILGFSPDARSFQPAKKYTPHLSALIYIQRLLFLEYALPLRPYTHLGIPRRSRFQQHQHFDVIRQRYMITGSQSPLEEFQSLRDFGRVIARTDPPSFLLRWSDDGETVSYGDEFSLTMDSFRGLAEHFLVKAEALCDDLMFGLNPEIDLGKVKDDLTNTQYGFSFVQHPANRLADAYLDLSTKACTTRRNGLFRDDHWDWNAIFSYRKKAESLLEMLGGVFQTGGGQLARVSELVSLECENGSSTERGLYVYNGSLIFITRHHKAKRSTNREFNVVRFLHVRGGHVAFKYLVYIRPLLEMLRREGFSYPDPSISYDSKNILFRSDQTPYKPWDSSRFTSILKKATMEVWKLSVNTQLYRQLTIGITEKHVREVHKPFNRFDDKTAAADMNVAFAWQSGHRPIQRATTYGLDGAFPAQLQPALLGVYEWASTRWHEFLHQASKNMPPTRTLVRKSLSPQIPQAPEMNNRPAKRKTLPWARDDVQENRPSKRRVPSEQQDVLGAANDSPDQNKSLFVSTEHLVIPISKKPTRPADIITRVDAWQEGAGGIPVSSDEGDSPIDWDEPDMIASDAPTDGTRPFWSRAPWPSWQRHNTRIESKIDKARQFHGVFDIKELRAHEQRAMLHLKRSLESWSENCVVCDFKGNPGHRHLTQDCPDHLYLKVQTWMPLFLTKIQKLVRADTQNCSTCFVPRLLCNRWKQGTLDKWAESGTTCQHEGIVLLTIITGIEGAIEVRQEVDIWMDSWFSSRNIDVICQWLSVRTISNDLRALRVVQLFTMVSSAWGRLGSSNQGYYSPSSSWITSSGPASQADNAADDAARVLREKKRENEKIRNRREGRDWSALKDHLLSWVGKCPICYIQQKLGHDVDAYHSLQACKDSNRGIVELEVAKLEKVKFARGLCCQLCAVPEEMCEDSVYFRQKGDKECLYEGIVCEAIAAIMVVGPDIVVEKMYAWMRSKRVWVETVALTQEEADTVTQLMLEWFSRKASWQNYTASVLVQVFTQLNQWVVNFCAKQELEDWYEQK